MVVAVPGESVSDRWHAPLLMAVDVPAAGSILRSGTWFAGQGWILSDSPIREVTVWVAGRLLCHATYGVFRPDLASGFPQYPAADHAGFSFSARLDLPPQDNLELIIRAQTVAGIFHEERVAVSLHSGNACLLSHPDPGTCADARVPLELHVDAVRLTGRGTLQVVGWAIGATPMREICVYDDQRLLGTADLGLPRADIVVLRPEAGRCGFMFATDLGANRTSLQTVRVRAKASGDVVREVVVPVESTGVGSDGSDDDGIILMECDHASIAKSGEIRVDGWAFGGSDVAELRILLDDQELGPASERVVRDDVGETYSGAAHALQSGFRFRYTLGRPIEGPHVLSLRATAPRATTRVLHLPVFAIEPALCIDQLASPPREQTVPFKCEIDTPVLSGGSAAEPITGHLTIQGWALARAGVAGIEILLDGTRVGRAYFGIRREDVASAFPDWSGALNCGFGMSIPPKTLKPGRRQVCVRVSDNAGRISDVEFTILVEQSGTETPAEMLRQSLPLSVLQLNRQILTGLRWAPCFHLVLDLRTAGTNLTAAATTLADLAAQEYDAWQLTLLVGRNSIEEGALRGLLENDDRLAERAAFDDGDGSWPALPRPLKFPNSSIFTGLLRAGDRLGCDALLEIAVATGLDPQADFVYSDERRADPATGSIRAFFKPQWSPDLLLSTNYIGRAWFAQASLLDCIGSSSRSLLLHGDYDLVLRLTHAAARIIHVPKVLCERATGMIDDAITEQLALCRTMEERSIAGQVSAGPVTGVYRLQRSIRRAGLISIIIATRAARGLVRTCIESIRRITTYRDFEIVCIENIPFADTDSRTWVRGHADRVITTDDTFNWSRFNNQAVTAASEEADYYLFLNDDVEIIQPDWLNALLEHAQRDDVGAVGALLLYPDLSIQHAGMFMPTVGAARHAFRFSRPEEPGPFGLTLAQREVIGVTGACMMVRREVFERLGRFDETHTIVNNDLDFCLRCIDSGLRVVYTPHSLVVHHEMASRSSQDDAYHIERFEHAWGSRFAQGDPYYHPALARHRDDFSLDPEPLTVIQANRATASTDQVRTILALKLDHIGDFITAFPAFRHIKRCFPRARLCALVSTAAVAIAALEPSIDEVIEFNFFNAKSGLGKLDVSETDLMALQRQLEPYRFDVAVDLRKHLETRHILRCSGAAVAAGFDYDGRFPWLDVALEWEGDAPLVPKRRHISEDLIDLVDAVANHFAANPAVCRPVDSGTAPATATLPAPHERLFDKPVVCVHPASGNALRQWPAEHFAQLIALLLRACDVNIAIIGGPDERELVESIAASAEHPESVHGLAGIVRLRDLPTFIARCAMFVGNNSGPKHLAAALGIPTIGIHSGVVDAQEWAPIGRTAIAIRRDMSCSPCYLTKPEQCPRGFACLTETLPGQILDTCIKLLMISAPGVLRPRIGTPKLV